jgi:hypothetical protein
MLSRIFLGLAIVAGAAPALAEEPPPSPIVGIVAPPRLEAPAAFAGPSRAALPVWTAWRPSAALALARVEAQAALVVERAATARAACGDATRACAALEALGEAREALRAALGAFDAEGPLADEDTRRVDAARRAAGLGEGAPRARLAPEAATAVRDAARAHADAGRFGDALAVAEEWRALAALLPPEPAARDAAEEIEALARECEARRALERLGLRVTGVLLDAEDPGRSVVLVNGWLARPGDEIRPERAARVDAIERDRVWIRIRGYRFAVAARPDA